MFQSLADSTASAGFSAFGVAPSGYAILLWAPLLALTLGLTAWLVALVILQRRRPRRLRPTATLHIAWTRHRLDDPQTQP